MKKIIIVSVLATLLWGCFSETTESLAPSKTNAPKQLTEEKIPEGLFGEISEENALSVKEIKTKKGGEKVKVKAKVIGRTEPFVNGRAVFVVGDPKFLVSCDLRAEDNCATPWDVCCMSKNDILENTMSIQVLGIDGKVLKASLKGEGDLNHLSQLVIEGVVDASSTADATILNAEKIFVLKK